MSTPYVLAIDFEAAGGIPSKNGFTQLGAALVSVSNPPKVVWTYNRYANMNGFEWEERCVNEFWSKEAVRFKETIEACKNAESPYEVIKDFNKNVNELAKIYDFFIITDNSTFDTGIYKYFSTDQNILYVTGKYRNILDVTAFYSGLSRVPYDDNADTMELLLKSLNKTIEPDYGVKHDHHPVNDATKMAFRFAWVLGHLQKQSKQ